MPQPAQVPRRTRIVAFDGLRGVAIILVVLSHGWTLWPTDQLKSIRPLDGLFLSGNLAVTLFFVVGGFVVTQGLLSQIDQLGCFSPPRFFARRFVRLGVQLYPLLLVVFIVSLVDHSDQFRGATTRGSVLSIGTYNWNWYLINNALTSRSDLGHLWYLSVEQQIYVVLALALVMFARRRVQLAIALAVVVVMTALWRVHILDVEGWWRASLRTTTRMDSLLLGALAAILLPWLEAIRRHASAILWAAGAALLGVVLTSGFVGQFQYLEAHGLVFNAAATVFVVAAYHQPDRTTGVLRCICWRPIPMLGRASLSIYLWHYPLFWAIARHTASWGWFPRTLLAFASLAVIVLFVQRVIEVPVSRWLQTAKNGAPKTAESVLASESM
jgi:peptidoglycan/LPS O-acetylase OafA/YrhL